MTRAIARGALLGAAPGVALLACLRHDPPVSAAALEAALAAAGGRGAGARVALAEVVPSRWDRVYVFGPYTPAAVVARCVGPGGGDVAQGIEARDDVTLLVFRFPDRPPRGVVVSRRAGDFAPEAARRWYRRRDAVFAVRRPPAGSWGTLTPAGGPAQRCD